MRVSTQLSVLLAAASTHVSAQETGVCGIPTVSREVLLY
jgi:hypothetical protein